MAYTTSADLEILIQQGEGATLEFKERLSSSFARELVALADSFVTVTFRPNPEVRQAAGGELTTTPQVTDQVTPEVAPEVAPEFAPEVTGQVAGQVTDQVTDQVTREVPPQVLILQAIFGEMSRQEIQEALGLKHTRHFRKAYLAPTLRAGLIEMTIPDKPRSSKQRYRLTPAGRRYLRRTETQTTTKMRQ